MKLGLEFINQVRAQASWAAEQLTRSAQRQFTRNEIPANSAPLFSYFLNYSGLDRYNRQGVRFVFDPGAQQFHYEGSAWREIVSRYPRSSQAEEARRELAYLASLSLEK